MKNFYVDALSHQAAITASKQAIFLFVLAHAS